MFRRSMNHRCLPLMGPLHYDDDDDGFVFLLLGELFNLSTAAWRDGADISNQMFLCLLIWKGYHWVNQKTSQSETCSATGLRIKVVDRRSESETSL